MNEQLNFGQWVNPAEQLPGRFRPVLVCREKNNGECIVEQGCLDIGDWWKVYGTRVKRVIAWMPMPLPPVLF